MLVHTVLISQALALVPQGANDDWDSDLADVQLTSSEASTGLGTTVALGDLNGDGFDDAVVAAPVHSGSATWYGEVYVLYGPNIGEHELTDISVADAIIEGESDEDRFGHALAVGDLDGDGVEDLVVGAPSAGSGTIYVFYGPVSSVDTDSDGTPDQPFSASSADMIIESTGMQSAGYSLVVADLDHSSGLELAIGAPNYDGGDGAVFIFEASTLLGAGPLSITSDADYTYYGEDDERAGYSMVAAIQDSDGHANLAVGAPEAEGTGGSGEEGRVYLLDAGLATYTGATYLSSAAESIIESTSGGYRFGAWLGDGYGHTLDTFGTDLLPWLVVGAEDGVGTPPDTDDVNFFMDPWTELPEDRADADWWTASNESLSPSYDVGKSFALVPGVSPIGTNAVVFGDPNANHEFSASSESGAAYLVRGFEYTDRPSGSQAHTSSCTSPWDLVFFDGDSGAAGDLLGWSMAAGDVNGDGIGDLLVGIPGNDGDASDGGAAALLYGPWSPMDGEVDLGDSTTIFDGVDNDDYAGVEVTDIGDVNCDGIVDIAVGANRANSGGAVGAAYVFFGPDVDDEGALSTFVDQELDDADLVFYGESHLDRAGQRIAGVGDIDDDGCDDLVISAPFNDSGATDGGTVYLFYGDSTLSGTIDYSDADASFEHGGASDLFGIEVVGIGDFDLDGIDDFAVGATDFTATIGGSSFHPGAVFLFLGNSTRYSGSYTPATDADCRLVGASGGDDFGISISGPLDFNGDGDGDLAIGASLVDDTYASKMDSGAVYIWQSYPCTGTTTKVSTSTADIKVRGIVNGDQFGHSLSVVGDLDGDGKDEMVVGAPSPGTEDWVSVGTPEEPLVWESMPGSVAIVPGGLSNGSHLAPAGGLVIAPDWSTLTDELRFGWSVDAGNIIWEEEDGDDEVWDEDHLPDIIVGAPFDDSSAGGVYLYDGSVLEDELGSTSNLDHAAYSEVLFLGEIANDWAGGRVRLGEDLNRDSRAEVLVGACGVDIGVDSNVGMAYLILSTHVVTE